MRIVGESAIIPNIDFVDFAIVDLRTLESRSKGLMDEKCSKKYSKKRSKKCSNEKVLKEVLKKVLKKVLK